MDNETCGTCKFKLINPNNLSDLQCRRNPPTVLLVPEPGGMGVQLAIKAAYPPVHAKQPACGEYKLKIAMQ